MVNFVLCLPPISSHAIFEDAIKKELQAQKKKNETKTWKRASQRTQRQGQF